MHLHVQERLRAIFLSSVETLSNIVLHSLCKIVLECSVIKCLTIKHTIEDIKRFNKVSQEHFCFP